MRSLTTTLIWIVSLNVICAQVPLGFSFQTIIRDSEGKVLKNQATGLQFSILEGSAMGTVVYSETHTITTNEYGVINLTVGTGTVTEGVFADIVWGSNVHFLKTEIDPTGGNTYTISTTSQLMSVPYAMYAMKADTALKVPDSSITNEIQVISISNDTIYLSDGGFAKLPAGFDGDYTSLTNKPTIPASISDLTNDSGFLTSEVDGSTTNEIQVLSISNDTIYLSDGGAVKIPKDTLIPSIAKNGYLLYGNQNKWDTLSVGLPGQQLIIDENGLPKWTGDTYPTVSTVSKSNITATSGSVSVNITSDGGQSVSSRGVVYGTSDNPTLSNSYQVSGSGTGSFSVTVNNLTPSTTYYVRGYATNSVGTGYGSSLNFTTTAPTLPILSTNAVSSITHTSAVSGGVISSDGGSAISAKGVVWSTNTNPTLSDNSTSDGTGTGNYNSTLTGLTPSTLYYVRAYATNSSGTGYGEERSITTSAAPVTVTDIDGNVYNTVQIGDQVWMKENLKTSRYNTGSAIPNVVNNGSSFGVDGWDGLSTGAWSYYNHDENNNAIYGKLYNWYAVEGDSLCPTGWHVPSDAEWTVLTDYLGVDSVAGGKLKEVGTTHWNSPNTGATDEVGFTALPGGLRSDSGSFSSIRDFGYWWIATSSSYSFSWGSRLDYSNANVLSFNYGFKREGFSVRCLRD